MDKRELKEMSDEQAEHTNLGNKKSLKKRLKWVANRARTGDPQNHNLML